MTDDIFLGGQNIAICNFSISTDKTIPVSTETFVVSSDVDDGYIRAMAPSLPVPILHPDKLTRKAESFVDHFTGHVLYAVKCNPDVTMLKAMYKGGVRRFDVASIGEVRLISGLFPDAKIYFMHPIKAPEAIREAYLKYGVRCFVLDYKAEIDKILNETDGDKNLELFVRLAVPKDTAGGGVATDFARKFGAKPDEAAELLKLCRPYCAKLGLSFHVGTQCETTDIYSKAVMHAADVIKKSGVQVDVLDVGGGFPADLNSDAPVPPVKAFTSAIADAVQYYNLEKLELLCEVGRGLVACAGSLVVRVEGRKDDLLYINDGTYGGLFEAGGSVGLPYPAHLIRRDEHREHLPLKAFKMAGPTCDSVDMMNGPFMLPDDIQVGDWIRLEQLGAYGEVSRTDFNGFGLVQKIIVRTESYLSEDLSISTLEDRFYQKPRLISMASY
jgi:ornithine decarboxylase